MCVSNKQNCKTFEQKNKYNRIKILLKKIVLTYLSDFVRPFIELIAYS